jgi:hypothetical protein
VHAAGSLRTFRGDSTPTALPMFTSIVSTNAGAIALAVYAAWQTISGSIDTATLFPEPTRCDSRSCGLPSVRSCS